MSGVPLPRPPRRILVVKLADLGDALLATPAIHALRQTFPSARIDALTTPVGASILALSPDVDRILPFPKNLFDRPQDMVHPARAADMARLAGRLRVAHYDASVLLHHLTTRFGAAKFRALCLASGAPVRVGLDNGRGEFLTHRAIDVGFGARTEWEYGLDVVGTLGATTSDTRPVIIVPDAAEARVRAVLAGRGIRPPFAVIHPSVGGYSPGRAWPADRFAAVARALRDRHGVAVVVVGAPQEAALAKPLVEGGGAVNLVGATSVSDLAALLRRAALVIGSDSGVVHLAAALETPTLAIFGFSNPGAWKPYGAAMHLAGRRPLPTARAIALRADIPCSPCFYIGYGLGRRTGCTLKTCLDLIAVEEVVATAAHLLASARTGA